jgi:4-amino-4-deoxy-L-arabinose transferase-like glycosyltransferase
MLSEQQITGTSGAAARPGLIDRLTRPYAEALILLLFVLVGGVIRYLAIPPYQVIAADGPSYLTITKSILADLNFRGSIHYPPFYPLLIAIASTVTKDLEAAGVLVSFVMGCLLPVPVFLLGKELFGRGAAYVAAAIVLVWPDYIGLSNQVLAHSTYYTLLMTGLYFLWCAYNSGRNLTAVFSGIFIAAAYLSRQEAFISLAAICSCLAVATYYRERSFNRIKPLLVAFGVFSLLSFPYIWMVHQVMGIWTMAGKSVVTLTDCLGYYLQKTDLNRDPSFQKIGLLEIIKNYPGYFPYTLKVNTAELIAILPDPLIFFAGIGFLVKQQAGKGLQIRAFILGALFPVAVLVTVFIVTGGYIAPYVPFLFMLAGHGMISMEKMLIGVFSRRLGERGARFFFVTGIIVLAYVANEAYKAIPRQAPGPYTLEMDGGRYDHKRIGLLLRKVIPAGSVIMTRSGRIGFYSGLPWVDLPQSDLDAIISTAREKKARFLIVDGLLIRLRPQLGKLLDPLQSGRVAGVEIFQNPEEVMPGVLRRMVYTDYESQGVVVYEIKP